MFLISAKDVDDIREKEKKFSKNRNNTGDPSERMTREIEDIYCVLEFLSTSERMPLIMASTCQIKKSPKTLGSVEPDASMGDVLSKMASMEKCLAKFMDSSMKQFETLTEAVSDKKVTEVAKPVTGTCNTPGKKRRLNEDGENTSLGDDNDVTEIVVNEKESYASKTMSGITPLKRTLSQSRSQGPPQSSQMLKNVLINMMESRKQKAEREADEKTKDKAHIPWQGYNFT